MGKFVLPKKIYNKTIFKFFLVMVIIFSGYYFYFSQKDSFDKKNNFEVLQSTTTTAVPLYQIDSYIMKDVIKPTCDKNQPYMDFFCRRTEEIISATGVRTSKISRNATFGVNDTSKFDTYKLTSTQTSSVSTQDSGVEFYTNPVLEEISGVPILAYYGGIYEIVLNQNPQKVVNITRTYKTNGNVGYTAGCRSSWFPSNLGKGGNTIIFGSGGLEDLLENRCYSQQVTSGEGTYPTGWGTTFRGDRDCKPRADLLGIQTIPNCTPTATKSCWDTRYRCETLNGFTQYYNIPFISVLGFTKGASDANGAVLKVSNISGMKVVPSSGGAATPDAYSFCRGKTKNDCLAPSVELAYGDNYVLKCGPKGCNDYGTNNPPQYGMPVTNGKKTFYKRVYSRNGTSSIFQDSTDLKMIYGGYDTPSTAYSAVRRVDLFQIDNFFRGGTAFLKYTLTPTLYDGMQISPAPYLLGLDWYQPSFIDVVSGALQDYVSDKYFYSLNYRNNNLILTRFLVTGFCGWWWDKPNEEQITGPCYPRNGINPYNPTYFTAISIPNVNLTYTRNITFSINSAEDVDIMIAPNFKDSVNNPNAKTRMFRAQKFNSPTGSYRLYELTSSTGGYQFLDPEPGNNVPLTFRYYNNADSDINNDYAVFVSRNYVFSSKIPPSPPICTPNFGAGPSLINLNPNSSNLGLNADDFDDPTTFDLKFSFAQPLVLACPSGNIPVPAGTNMKISLYDGINKDLIVEEDAKLLTDRKSFNYSNIAGANYSKYFYQISFEYDGNTYEYPANIDNNRYFTLESFLTINSYLNDGKDTPLRNAKFTVTKNLNTTVKNQYTISSPQPDFSLYSRSFNTFFFDHNLSLSGNKLVDNYNYRICSNDGKISKVGFTGENTSPTSITNDNMSATITNDCLNVAYRSSDPSSYLMIPQSLDLYVVVQTSPPSQNLLNFRVNGNVMVKNSLNLQYYSNTNAKYKGVIVSNNASGTKNFNGSANFSTYFKIPYFSDLKSGINLSFTPDLTLFSVPDSGLDNYILLSNLSQNISSSYKTIDVIATLAAPQAPTIIYVARDKQMLFDLKDTNLQVLTSSGIKGYFVSIDSITPENRIVFKVNCSDLNNYREICINKASVNIKGGFYGNIKTNLANNAEIESTRRSYINIIQDPEILLDLQIKLRSNKIFNVTRSKTVFRYLNN